MYLGIIKTLGCFESTIDIFINYKNGIARKQMDFCNRY